LFPPENSYNEGISIIWGITMSRKPRDSQLAAVPSAAEGATRLVKQLQIVNPAPDVIPYLIKHSYLLPLLAEARAALDDYFAQPALSLEIHSDPELAQSQAVLLVGTSLKIDEALRQLEQFRQDWWLDEIDRAQGNLLIGLDWR
jgi:hypothetical protein